MTQQTTFDAIRRTVTVAAPAARAFEIFAARMGTWWPAAYRLGASDRADVVLEPEAGGRWYERGVDGSECQWGRVLAYEPPHRLLLAWQINGEWSFDPDPEHGSEVEVRFVEEAPDRTRVELEHRGFERHGAGAAAVHGGVGGDGGWPSVLESYATVVSAAR